MIRLITTITTAVASTTQAASNAVNRKLDELFPRIWFDTWENARTHGWEPDPPETYCRRCGCTIHHTAQLATGCAFCHTHVYPWRSITRLTTYSPAVRVWIHQFKFQRQWKWGPLLGRELAKQLTRPDKTDRTFVCAVPIHLFKRMKRGYNQSHYLAKAIARHHRLPLVQVLKRQRHRPSQSTVPMSQRTANISRAFRIANVDLTGWTVWLVDDVKTTGSTLRQCARLLKQAGAKEVHVAVVAVADPKDRDFTRL